MENINTPDTTGQVFVLDIPVETSAEDMAGLLNRQCAEHGVYLNSVLQWPGTGARAVFRRLVRQGAKRSGPGEVKSSAKPPRSKGDKDGKETAAVALMKANPELASRKMSELLKAEGIDRSYDWVARKRNELSAFSAGRTNGQSFR